MALAGCASKEVSPSAAPAPDAITFDQTDFRSGIDARTFQIQVRVMNHDASSHPVDVEANFYDAPISALGNDLRAHFITAGTTTAVLQAGQSSAILVRARNVNQAPIRSVSFMAICWDDGIPTKCGTSIGGNENSQPGSGLKPS